MDKRLAVEFVPGLAFVIGGLAGGLFAGAGLAAIATALSIWLRWRWDQSLPWLAIAILVLTLILLLAGLALDDTTFVKISPTIGSLVFAAIIGLGWFFRPSLLERTLGYTLCLTGRGWTVLHQVWIAVSLLRAAVNEVVWRHASEGLWMIYNGFSDIVWIGLFVVSTWTVARFHWDGPNQD